MTEEQVLFSQNLKLVEEAVAKGLPLKVDVKHLAVAAKELFKSSVSKSDGGTPVRVGGNPAELGKVLERVEALPEAK